MQVRFAGSRLHTLGGISAGFTLPVQVAVDYRAQTPPAGRNAYHFKGTAESHVCAELSGDVCGGEFRADAPLSALTRNLWGEFRADAPLSALTRNLWEPGNFTCSLKVPIQWIHISLLKWHLAGWQTSGLIAGYKRGSVGTRADLLRTRGCKYNSSPNSTGRRAGAATDSASSAEGAPRRRPAGTAEPGVARAGAPAGHRLPPSGHWQDRVHNRDRRVAGAPGVYMEPGSEEAPHSESLAQPDSHYANKRCRWHCHPDTAAIRVAYLIRVASGLRPA